MIKKIELENNFQNSSELKFLVENNIINLKPWEIIFERRLNLAFEGLKKRYPDSNLIPFAVKTDCDDIACFDLNSPDLEVIIIHDYSSVAWETRERFKNFWDWFRKAVEDMIEFAKSDIEYEKNNKPQ